jgi:hypothetical protein
MHKCCMGVADAEARPVQEILVEDGYRAVSAYLDQRDTAALNSSPWTPFRDGDLDTAAGPAGSPLIGDGHGPPGLPSAALASWPTAWAAGNRAILPATHTIGVAQCALRRSLRSARPAELAGRSCLHRWARSGLPCLQASSGGVWLGRVSARQGNGSVCQSLAGSAVAWGRCHLVRHWQPASFALRGALGSSTRPERWRHSRLSYPPPLTNPSTGTGLA